MQKEGTSYSRCNVVYCTSAASVAHFDNSNALRGMSQTANLGAMSYRCGFVVTTSLVVSVAHSRDIIADDAVPKSGVGIVIGSQGTNSGTLAVGYRSERSFYGVTTHFSLDYAEGGLPPDGTVGTLVNWGVGGIIAPALYISRDSRAELVGRVGFGVSGFAASNDTGSVDTSFLTFEAGLGVNYWLHPQFAIGGQMAVNGALESSDFLAATVKTVTGIQAMFVF